MDLKSSARDESIRQLWDKLLAAGRPFGLKPCGLGARDTLRTEVCYPLYGHELDEDTTPMEAGLGFFVALDKGEFIGRAVLGGTKGERREKETGRVQNDRTNPRRRGRIIRFGRTAPTSAKVTSGTQSPSLGIGIGMGYVPPAFAKPDTRLKLKFAASLAALVVAKPIYRRF